MSSTRHDPECDLQGCIPRYLEPSVFGEGTVPEETVTSLTAVSVPEVPVHEVLADNKTTRAGLSAARAALALASSMVRS